MDHNAGAEGLAAHMNKMLANKNASDLDRATQLATTDLGILEDILRGIVSKNAIHRYNCFRAALQLSETQPQVFHPDWDYFIEPISRNNSYHRSASLGIVTNATKADTRNRFEDIVNEYFNLLDDDSLIAAGYFIRNAGRIAVPKPSLQTRVTERLLGPEETHHDEIREDLIEADAIRSFGEFFEAAHDQEKTLAFVEPQLECDSPKTGKVPRDFLNT